MTDVAIIGAGASGLAAAWELEQAGWTVELFDKSRGVSGRATTRRRDGLRYDHGAQYFKLPDPEVRQRVTETWHRPSLTPIPGAIWLLDDRGLHPGDESRNQEIRWHYENGINELGKSIAAHLKATIHTQTRITSLRQSRETPEWWLQDEKRQGHGPYQAVLITAPAPQSRELIDASGMDLLLRDTLVEALAEIQYNACLSLILHFSETLPRPDSMYGLVCKEEKSPLRWIAFESDKPHRGCDENETLLVVQMSHEWSVPRLRDSLDSLVEEVMPLLHDALGGHFSPPQWSDVQRWRFAIPRQLGDANKLSVAEEAGLFFAGDGLVGGRLCSVLRNGLDTARRIHDSLA